MAIGSETPEQRKKREEQEQKEWLKKAREWDRQIVKEKERVTGVLKTSNIEIKRIDELQTLPRQYLFTVMIGNIDVALRMQNERYRMYFPSGSEIAAKEKFGKFDFKENYKTLDEVIKELKFLSNKISEKKTDKTQKPQTTTQTTQATQAKTGQVQRTIQHYERLSRGDVKDVKDNKGAGKGKPPKIS